MLRIAPQLHPLIGRQSTRGDSSVPLVRVCSGEAPAYPQIRVKHSDLDQKKGPWVVRRLRLCCIRTRQKRRRIRARGPHVSCFSLLPLLTVLAVMESIALYPPSNMVTTGASPLHLSSTNTGPPPRGNRRGYHRLIQYPLLHPYWHR